MMSLRSTHGYAVAWIFDLKLLSSGSLGMSTQWPSQLYFQPWYTQRRPSSSLRPKKRDAPRCGQWFWMRPILPDVTRKAIRFSPRSRTRTGAPSRSGSSLDMRAGIQYCRSMAPTGVPGPTRQSSSLSSLESFAFSFRLTPLCHGRRRHVALDEAAYQDDHGQHHDRHHESAIENGERRKKHGPEDPEAEHQGRYRPGHPGREVQQASALVPAPRHHVRHERIEDHPERRGDDAHDQAVGQRQPVHPQREHPPPVVERVARRVEDVQPDEANEADLDQHQRRQYDRDDEEEHHEAEGDPAQLAQRHRARRVAPAGHGRVVTLAQEPPGHQYEPE